MTSTYHSQTHGLIPLSKDGRALLGKLRDAIGDYKTARTGWEPVAHARGELARYMSRLEAKLPMFIGPNPPETAMTATEANIRQECERMERAKLERYRKDPWDGFMQQHAEQLMKPWYSGTVSGRITGNRITGMILDDPQQELSNMAKKKADATRKKAEAKFRVVGVRFLSGTNLAKVYCYKARKAAKVHLGQELVVRNEHGLTTVVVVSLDQLEPGWTIDGLKEITLKVAAL